MPDFVLVRNNWTATISPLISDISKVFIGMEERCQSFRRHRARPTSSLLDTSNWNSKQQRGLELTYHAEADQQVNNVTDFQEKLLIRPNGAR